MLRWSSLQCGTEHVSALSRGGSSWSFDCCITLNCVTAANSVKKDDPVGKQLEM